MPKKGKAAARRIIRSPSLGSDSESDDPNDSIRAPSQGGTRGQSRVQSLSRPGNRAQGQSRSPSPIPSDYELFYLSDSPEEDWGDDEDKEWPVRGVVGQEILGNRQIRYQVEWENWQREDGTNTTWTIGIQDDETLIRAWDKKRSKEKAELAKSPDIDLEVLGNYLPHDFRTAEDTVAYNEKWEKWKNKEPEHWKEWLAMIYPDSNPNAKVKGAFKEEDEEERVSIVPEAIRLTKSKKRKRDGSSSASGSVSRASSSRLGEDESSSTLYVSPVPSSSRSSSSSMRAQKPKFRLNGFQQAPSTLISRSSISQQDRTTVIANQTNQSLPLPMFLTPRSRLSLQTQWEKAVYLAGAANITIVNEIDDWEIPTLPPSFRYLENRCIYDTDVPDPRTDDIKGFMTGCDCEDGCSDVLACSCFDEYEDPEPAYDNKGLFLFNDHPEVVECNELCACIRNNGKCNNAVAQKPRTIPIEIFKTLNNGWGARSPVRIKRGTVLGLYTGKIIKRDKLRTLNAEERDYTFDLDIRDDDDQLERYTVCAYNEGNWTRFVNHSCSPNTIVYSVVFDAPVMVNMPYIAFVATQDIPPRTEITVDYNPSAARNTNGNGRKKKGRPKGKGKGKGKATSIIKIEEDEDMDMDVDMLTESGPGKTRCVCGSADCRGFI